MTIYAELQHFACNSLFVYVAVETFFAIAASLIVTPFPYPSLSSYTHYTGSADWVLQKEKKVYALDEDGNRIPLIDPATGNLEEITLYAS